MMAVSVSHSCCKSVMLLTVFSLMFVITSGNQMDPHVYPAKGPFFEGWYMRIIDPEQGQTFGWLFGKVLPQDENDGTSLLIPPTGEGEKTERYPDKIFTRSFQVKKSKKKQAPLPLVYSSLLLNPSVSQKLEGVTGFFPTSEYKVTKNGKPVEVNPDDKTPPEFEAVIGKNVTFEVKPNGTKFFFDIEDYVFSGETSQPAPWGPNGEGPEGALSHLPLPIHWFIYSLRSDVIYYEVRNKKTGKVVHGGSSPGKPVVAHMEKNWGKSFPKAWVWAEGVNPQNNVSFSISSGKVTFAIIDVKAQLSGYRNPGKNIHCSFSPDNSLHTLEHDGCAGTATLDVRGLECRVVFQIAAKPASFSSCLYTPQVEGFRKGCVESYTAVTNVTVYQRHGWKEVITDQQTIPLSALEFGEEYMCNSSCPKY